MTESPATIGRYHVARLIAHGGMGSLYLARDPAIDRLIAIKLLREGFEDDALRERFAREARSTGRLRHPNIVTVFDIGEHENRPFIAMEYVPGENLAQLIRRRARIPLVEKLAILEDLCAALHYAHSEGIVHRDIKPANVMLEDVSGTLKVLDFGIARAGDSGLTGAGEMVGTLNYMSPEQIGGDSVDHRTDVYAVGVLAYEFLSYRRAFPGTIQDGALLRILESGPAPLGTLLPDIDPGITGIVETAMARAPAQRYQDMERLRLDLADVRNHLIDLGAGAEEFPAALIDGEAETTVGPSAESPTVLAPPTPGKSFRERPLSGSRGSSSVRRGTSASSARARTPSGAGSPVEQVEQKVEERPDKLERPGRNLVTLGALAAALLLVLAVAFFGIGRWGAPPEPLVQGPAVPPQAAPPAAQTTPATPVPNPVPPPVPDKDQGAGRPPLGEQLRSMRATAQRQIAAGQHQQALDTLGAGLVLDAGDPELRNLIDGMARAARQGTTQARADASRLGITELLSPDFRDALAREREAELMDRSGNRAPAIRTYWTAIGLYQRAGSMGAQSTSAPPAPGPLPRTEIEKTDTPRPDRNQPVAPPAPPIAVTPLPPLPASALKPELPAAAPAARDTQPPDAAAIRDTLHRYADAYRSRDSAAVSKVMPSLSPQQLRALDRDFSNLRSYGVGITNERIVVDGATATAACQVVRSFVTLSGVAGGNTVATVFTLRKTGGAWVIEKVESR